ncbi:hypothetical protein FD754_007613 [Muntiacus muntjak]|uniref:Uncharacterized protein n=1 Tax=Muntiacus muntjak TaxID=9888 RepID=A0A5N3WRD4_MUNMU|nr:hypothetical protein FD754_007613 [Muntiacus muntjak]
MARMNPPAPVEVTYKNMRFLITHNPTNVTLNKFGEELKKFHNSVRVLNWPFDDGAPPSNQIVDDWLSLVKTKFREDLGGCIAVPCVAVFGRAPELFVRQKWQGTFNSKQVLNLEKYHPKMWLRYKDSIGHRNNCCIQ